MHSHQEKTVPFLDLSSLRVIKFLGRGAKGVVFLVETENKQLLAMKMILRSKIERTKKKTKKDNSDQKSNCKSDEYRRVSFEKEVLASLDHMLLPKLRGVVVTDKIIGYAIDYCSGRDLHYLRKKQTEKMFSDDIIRFYAAELVLALEYLHNQGIAYRDLKPENVMIQSNGHLMLVDFDLSTKLALKSPQQHRTNSSPRTKSAKRVTKSKNLNALFKCRESEISPEESVRVDSTISGSEESTKSFVKSNSFVGTEEYVAPEIVLDHGHDFAVDLWGLGVMMYEMLYGTTPFRGANRKETFYRVVTKKPNLAGEMTPLRDLIGKLLEKDPAKRIRVKEVKEHAFFNGIDWDGILEIPRPPFIPELTEVEGIGGISDVERYVEGLFEEGKLGSLDVKEKKDGWVDNVNHPTQHVRNDNFLIF